VVVVCQPTSHPVEGISDFAFLVIGVHHPSQTNLPTVTHAGNGLRLDFALDSAGNNMAARMAMMAMTTNNSTKVKPTRFC